MIYIYDILLNFNNEFYEFFEWEKNDNIIHCKKIPIFKVKTSFIEDLLSKEIKLNSSFANLIYNKTEIYDNKKVKTIKYCSLVTDGYKVLGILLDNDYKVIKLSDLLIDEADDCLGISIRCNNIEIEYNILSNLKINYFLTRKEKNIKKYLLEEIEKIYCNKEILKLKYLYFEYFNKNEDNIDLIYKELISSLKEINKNHFKLFELVKLSNKYISNLTN